MCRLSASLCSKGQPQRPSVRKIVETFDRWMAKLYGRQFYREGDYRIAQSIGIVTDSVFASVAGTMGFAAVSELGRVVLQNSMKTALKAGAAPIL